MASRLIKWVLTGAVLSVSRAIKDATVEAFFDLAEIFPEFNSYDDVQQQTIIKGIKEKLADSGASAKGDAGGKISNVKEVWAQLQKREWKGERVNATGASQERKLGREMKTQAQAVTLQGLMMKKMLAGADPTAPRFTGEDEEKLMEFMAEVVKAGKKGK